MVTPVNMAKKNSARLRGPEILVTYIATGLMQQSLTGNFSIGTMYIIHNRSTKRTFLVFKNNYMYLFTKLCRNPHCKPVSPDTHVGQAKQRVTDGQRTK